MANRVRCTVCKGYFERENMYFSNRLSRICSEGCIKDYFDKKRENLASKPKKKPTNTRKGNLDSKIRQRVRRRDKDLCRWCGARGEQIHHVIYRSHGGRDHMSNLLLLCERHHQKAHSNKRVFQSILLATIWLVTVEGKWLTVPEVARELRRRDCLTEEEYDAFVAELTISPAA